MWAWRETAIIWEEARLEHGQGEVQGVGRVVGCRKEQGSSQHLLSEAAVRGETGL